MYVKDFVIDIKVVRQLMWMSLCCVVELKKPAGTAEEIEKHFGCKASHLIMVRQERGVLFVLITEY